MTGLGPTLRTLRYLRIGQIARRLQARALEPWFRSALYGRLALRPRTDVRLLRSPPHPWPGHPDNGRRLLKGCLRLIGRERSFAPPADWRAADEPLLWRFTLHYFEWLADLAATDDGEAPGLARNLIADWMATHESPDDLAWHPYPLSLRLYAWLAHAPFLLTDADDGWPRTFLTSLDRQARHLARRLEWDIGGNHLIKNLKALIAASLCLDGHGHRLAPALVLLEQQVARQILADGGHYERSPSYHLQVLCDLMDVRDLLTNGSPVPVWLTDAIERMASALAFFRHGDGGLALFNDGDVGDGTILAAVERRLGTLGSPSRQLAATGYHRLAAGGTVLLVDTGPCCPDDLPGHAHADTLSFELSDGQRRLVVNSGTYAYQDPAWRNRLRGTAAHSTVEVDGQDSAEVYGQFRLGRRPRHIGAHRLSGDTDTLAAHHDGYRHLGLAHARRLTLSADGRIVEGQDRIERLKPSERPHDVAVRFHLHPDVTAVAEDEASVLLLASGGPTWRFEATGERISLEPSVYAPRFYGMRESSQIVLRKALSGPDCLFFWSFTRLGE